MTSESRLRPVEDTVVVDSDRVAADEQEWPVAEPYRVKAQPDDDAPLAPGPAAEHPAPEQPPGGRRGRVFGLVLALLLAAAMLLVAAVLLSPRDGRAPERAASTTPSTIRSASRTALGTVTTVPLAPPRVEARADTTPPPPTKDAQVASVPSVVGRTASDAATVLRRAGLHVKIRPVFSDGPAGVVAGQSPPAGTTVAPGATIQLEVTKSRPLGTRVEVPDVVGLDVSAAEQRLSGLGLTVEVEQEASSETAGTVLRQSPRPGAILTERGLVTLTVSAGPQTVVVPDVVGLDEASARARLETAGLTVTVTYEPTTDTDADGTVVAQMPGAGTSVSPNDGVEIVVAKVG